MYKLYVGKLFDLRPCLDSVLFEPMDKHTENLLILTIENVIHKSDIQEWLYSNKIIHKFETLLAKDMKELSYRMEVKLSFHKKEDMMLFKLTWF